MDDRLQEIKRKITLVDDKWLWGKVVYPEDIAWLIGKVEQYEKDIEDLERKIELLSAHNLDLALDYAHLKTQDNNTGDEESKSVLNALKSYLR